MIHEEVIAVLLSNRDMEETTWTKIPSRLWNQPLSYWIPSLPNANKYMREHCNQSMLMIAAAMGHSQKVLFLLFQKADINKKEHGSQMTALMYAAMNRQYSIVHLLLDHGADVNAVDADGCSMLIYLLGSNGDETSIFNCISHAVNKGLLLNHPRNLHFAAYCDSVSFLAYLLETTSIT